ncbi:S-adenosyl-L-methionine-dependent methyltransferase [Xylariales sp. PMI_506]|nr:S-adenosyl-L-methionine-dependent methyltransferase [Xylariales sp. PMI_506]
MGGPENDTVPVVGTGAESGEYSRFSNSVQLPVLPSQLLGSYDELSPPAHFSLEDMSILSQIGDIPMPETMSFASDKSAPKYYDPDFSIVANGLINQSLDRTPSGGSVVDPESVIGESHRLYHGYKEGKYFMPNDAAEQDRLDMQHELFRIMYNGWLGLAPLTKPPKNVLDIGTGTGVWAFEFAEQNPPSQVIGVDLSTIQPNRAIPNCSFIKADVEDEWIIPDPNTDNHYYTETGVCSNNIAFDYIHLRLMFSCFDDARVVMRHAFDNMAPGGWIEFQEASPRFRQANRNFQGDGMKRWGEGCIKGAAASGRDIEAVIHYKKWLEDIGFTNVTERQFIYPLSGWLEDPRLKQLGNYGRQNALEGIRGAGWIMLRRAGMTTQEVEELINQCQTELADPANHVYTFSTVIYGRKPTSI